MKTKLTLRTLAILALSTLIYQPSTSLAQGTAFTYQGRLDESSGPANGSYDLTFRLFDAVSGGSSQGGPLTNSAVSVSDGYFTVTLDFGMNPFSSGADRWMEIAVRTNGSGAFGLLTPRQALTPAPYAIFSGNAPASGLSGTINSSSIANGAIGSNQLAAGAVTSAKLADGAALAELLDDDGPGSGLDADLLDGLHASAFWQLGGNAGTTPATHFVGTTDNQSLEFKVNGQRALRLSPGGISPNLIGGYTQNVIGGGEGSFIGGGGYSGYSNAIFTSVATIAGGFGNYIGIAYAATIGGGGLNSIGSNAFYATIAGGFNNSIGTNSHSSTINGGAFNQIATNSEYATIGGGGFNSILSGSTYVTIAGGYENRIWESANHSVIGGGRGNYIATNSENATIAGGANNGISASSDAGMIAGGLFNFIGSNSLASTIGGGHNNQVPDNANYATIPGGFGNYATNYAFAAGSRAKAIHTGAFVWADSQGVDFASTGTNQFLIRASGGVGIGETAPEAPLHVREGSAGTMTANANSVAVFEKSGSAYVSVLTPTANESGILFGSPTNSNDGGIVYNSSTPRGLDFRTAGNMARMVLTAEGSVGIGTFNPTNKLHVTGGITCTALVETSDRNAKQHFLPVDPLAVLAKVASLPITTWHFKELPDGRHMGPMAQDFHAAFGLGGSDQTITSIDRDGVALAAIQGLNQIVEQQQAQLEQKHTEIAELQTRLEKLERLLAQREGVSK